MDLRKILEKKELEARDNDNESLEDYMREHCPVDFKGHTIPYHEYEAIKGIMQKYKLKNRHVGFNDGHVTSLDLSAEGIKSTDEISGLGKLTNLQHLNLRWNKITEIKNLKKLTKLKELYLLANKITEISGLENLINLQMLDLRWNELNSDSERIINSLRERGVKVWT